MAVYRKPLKKMFRLISGKIVKNQEIIKSAAHNAQLTSQDTSLLSKYFSDLSQMDNEIKSLITQAENTLKANVEKKKIISSKTGKPVIIGSQEFNEGKKQFLLNKLIAYATGIFTKVELSDPLANISLKIATNHFKELHDKKITIDLLRPYYQQHIQAFINEAKRQKSLLEEKVKFYEVLIARAGVEITPKGREELDQMRKDCEQAIKLLNDKIEHPNELIEDRLKEHNAITLDLFGKYVQDAYKQNEAKEHLRSFYTSDESFNTAFDQLNQNSKTSNIFDLLNQAEHEFSMILKSKVPLEQIELYKQKVAFIETVFIALAKEPSNDIKSKLKEIGENSQQEIQKLEQLNHTSLESAEKESSNLYQASQASTFSTDKSNNPRKHIATLINKQETITDSQRDKQKKHL